MWARLLNNDDPVTPRLVKLKYKFFGSGHEWAAYFGRQYTGELDRRDAMRESRRVANDFLNALKPFLVQYEKTEITEVLCNTNKVN